jgi:hypothetical protein
MAEFLKIWLDLTVMSKYLPLPILKHYFTIYDLNDFRAYRESLKYFNMPELESSEYRSAYHQFTDWLYGWSVSDVPENDSNTDIMRVPRDISMGNDKERQEATRLMKTFETLASISIRHLKVSYREIDSQMPRVGQGLDTYSNSRNEDIDDILNGEDVNKKEKIWNIHKNPESGEEVIIVNEDVAILANNDQGELFESEISLQHQEGFNIMSTPSTELPTIVEPPAALPEIPPVVSESEIIAIQKDAMFEPEETKRALQRDTNHVYDEVEKSAEYTLVTLSGIAAIITFSQLLNDKETFVKASMWAHEISQSFVSNSLKTVWDLLKKEIPQNVSLEAVRNPKELNNLMIILSNARNLDPDSPKFKNKRIPQKFACIDRFFNFMDIHIFPNFAQVHTAGIFPLN